MWEKRRRLWAKRQLSLNQTFALSDTERKKRCLRRRGVAKHVVCVYQTSCSIHNNTFKLCLMLPGRVPTSQTRCTVDLVASCRNDWDYSMCSTLSEPRWAARHVELLDRHRPWISLLVCRQIPLRERNVPKCCAKTGIHTFLCTLTTFPSG